MTMPKIKLIFINSQNQQHDLDFLLIESHIAHRWIKKLRRIYKLPVNDYDSQLLLRPDPNRFDILKEYENFCKIAKIKCEPIDMENQIGLNKLHEIFEVNNDLIIKKDPVSLSRFHQAIHNKEYVIQLVKFKALDFGWGEKEGPLMEKLNMHQYYSKNIEKGNIYLKWSELGKVPTKYFADGEPNDQYRFNQLSIPNKTLRPKFFLQIIDKYSNFTPGFELWFDKFKKDWLTYHDLISWQPIDEFGGVHVAQPIDKVDLDNFFLNYPNLKSIEIN